MARLRYNGLRTTLGGALTTSGTTITFSAALVTGSGVNVATVAGGDYIPLCILSPTTGLVNEIVYLTAYTSGATTGTITRGQEGTSGIAHSTGDFVVQDVTAADFGVVTSYTPVWSGAGASQPTLGTGGTAVGFYSLHGPLCYFTLTITLGTAPGLGTAGSQYALSLPLTPTRDAPIFGTLRMGGNPYIFVADATSAGSTLAAKVMSTTAGNPNQNWTSAFPTAPIAGSVWRASGCFFWTT